MNDERNENLATQTRAQNLISHVVDGDASDEQWCEFETLAHANPLLWRELAETQRDQSALALAVSQAGVAAERVAAPLYAGNDVGHASMPLGRRIGAWSGWAVAALVAIVALPRLAQLESLSVPAPGMTRTGFLQSLSPAESYQHYLEKGREAGQVVGEMPAMVMVETRPAPTGQGYEVLYLRQVLERTVVPDLYQVTGQTEHGEPLLLRWEHRAGGSM